VQSIETEELNSYIKLNDYVDMLNEMMQILWIVFCTVMVILSQVGYMMKETGTIRMKNNSVILLKTILVISVSSLTFFFGGFGLAMEAEGGLMGQKLFFGLNYTYLDYTRFIYFLALCVKTSVIASGSIGERIEIDRYIFFSFLTSGFIFPLGLAWCWNDGWL
jgi:ammonium transporter, Amt family